MCESALRHRDTRELYLNKLRAVGPTALGWAYRAQLKPKQNRKQDKKQDTGIKTRQINNQVKHPCPNTLVRTKGIISLKNNFFSAEVIQSFRANAAKAQ